MKALVLQLKETLPTIDWFAMGEAVRIHGSIVLALETYEGEKTKPNAKKVRELAECAASFLSKQGTNKARLVGRKLKTQLDKIKMERKL